MDQKIETVQVEQKTVIVEEIKKHWLKSKTVILNGFTGLSALCMYGLQEVHDMLNQNLDWIKSSGINTKYIFLAMFVIGLSNVLLRFFTRTKITLKKPDGGDDASVSS